MVLEHEAIAEYAAKINRPGRFLEIGAFDGSTDSLTLPLVDAGWSGVMVEPEPKAFEALIKRHGDNPRIEFVNAAIGASGLRRFWAQKQIDQVSTLQGEFTTYWEENGQHYHRPYWINVLSAADLLHKFGGPGGWDFVLIDVEGTNAFVAGQFPWAEMQSTGLVCVESDGPAPGAVQKRLHPHYRTEFIRNLNVLGWRL